MTTAAPYPSTAPITACAGDDGRNVHSQQQVMPKERGFGPSNRHPASITPVKAGCAAIVQSLPTSTSP